MADKREHLELTDKNWELIELDPDSEGFTSFTIKQITTNGTGVQWSPINTIVEVTETIPENEPSRFDYNIYVKNANANTSKPIIISITRL